MLKQNMCISWVYTVVRTVIRRAKHRELYQYPNGHLQTRGIKWLSYPTAMHTFCIQFYPWLKATITEVFLILSPLSTPLIIRTKWVKERKLVISSGGLVA